MKILSLYFFLLSSLCGVSLVEGGILHVPMIEPVNGKMQKTIHVYNGVNKLYSQKYLEKSDSTMSFAHEAFCLAERGWVCAYHSFTPRDLKKERVCLRDLSLRDPGSFEDLPFSSRDTHKAFLVKYFGLSDIDLQNTLRYNSSYFNLMDRKVEECLYHMILASKKDAELKIPGSIPSEVPFLIFEEYFAEFEVVSPSVQGGRGLCLRLLGERESYSIFLNRRWQAKIQSVICAIKKNFENNAELFASLDFLCIMFALYAHEGVVTFFDKQHTFTNKEKGVTLSDMYKHLKQKRMVQYHHKVHHR